ERRGEGLPLTKARRLVDVDPARGAARRRARGDDADDLVFRHAAELVLLECRDMDERDVFVARIRTKSEAEPGDQSVEGGQGPSVLLHLRAQDGAKAALLVRRWEGVLSRFDQREDVGVVGHQGRSGRAARSLSVLRSSLPAAVLGSASTKTATRG